MSGAQSLLCEMLSCGSSDLEMLDRIGYGWDEILDQMIARKGQIAKVAGEHTVTIMNKSSGVITDLRASTSTMC